MSGDTQDEEPRDDYKFDPDTGLPQRLSAAERRELKERASAGGKKAAPRKGSSRAPKHSRNKSGSENVRVVETEDDAVIGQYPVTLPGGGTIILGTPAEEDYLKEQISRLQAEYGFTKPNDLSRLSQLAVSELEAWRLMQRMSGRIPRYDGNGRLCGYTEIEFSERSEIPDMLTKLQKEIRYLETALKIDRKTREGDGDGDIREYMGGLKAAAIHYGVHLSERYKAYDNFVNEMRWRLRVLENPDKDDRKYHQLEKPGDLVKWAKDELDKLHEVDKEFAANKQSLWMARNIP